MTATRLSLIQILANEFKQSDETKKRCCHSSQSWIQKKDLSRVFNGFPHLLPKSELESLGKKFIEILHHKQVAAYVEGWIVAIARRGLLELLNKKGEIEGELISVLEWSRYLKAYDKEDVVSLFCSFVQEITSQAHQCVDSDIIQYKESYTQFMKELNHQTKSLVEKVVHPYWDKKHDKHKKLSKQSDFPTIEVEMEVYVKQQKTKAFVSTASTAVGIIGAAVGLGMLVFQVGESKNPPANPKPASGVKPFHF